MLSSGDSKVVRMPGAVAAAPPLAPPLQRRLRRRPPRNLPGALPDPGSHGLSHEAPRAQGMMHPCR